MTTSKNFKVGTALEMIEGGQTVHCLGTLEVCVKAKREGALQVQLTVGKSVSIMPAQNFLGTYKSATFAPGSPPAETKSGTTAEPKAASTA